MRRISLLVVPALLMFLVAACPPTGTDGTPTPSGGTPTPQANVCKPMDVTANVDGANYMGNTNSEDDDFLGSCSFALVAESLLSFIAPAAGDYLISTANPGTDFDTIMFAFTDCDNPDDSELACNDDSIDMFSGIVVSATEGQEVFIAVEGYDGPGNFELSIETATCVDDGFEDNDNNGSATPIVGPFPASIDAAMCGTDESPDFPGFWADFYVVNTSPG